MEILDAEAAVEQSVRVVDGSMPLEAYGAPLSTL